MAWMFCSYETKKCNCNCKYKVNLSAGLCLVAKPQLPLIKFQTKLRFLSFHAPDMRKCIDLPSVALAQKGKSWQDGKFQLFRHQFSIQSKHFQSIHCRYSVLCGMDAMFIKYLDVAVMGKIKLI